MRGSLVHGCKLPVQQLGPMPSTRFDVTRLALEHVQDAELWAKDCKEWTQLMQV